MYFENRWKRLHMFGKSSFLDLEPSAIIHADSVSFLTWQQQTRNLLFSKITAKRVEFELKLVLQQIRLLQVLEMLRQKVDSTSTFCSKICTSCAFYQPKASLFCKCDVTLVYGVISRNFIQLEVTIHATCNNQRNSKEECFLPVYLS